VTLAVQDPRTLDASNQIEICFNKIQRENMEGILLLNKDLEVEAVEFQIWDDHIVGMVVTPWFLNLVMLPNENDNWETQKLGEKEKHIFPSQDLIMMFNEIEGFGRCKTFSLCSPMNDFHNQEGARIAGALFLRDLLDESKRVEPTYSETQIANYLEKEDMVHQEELKEKMEPIEIKEEVNRRDLIRGTIRKT